jgi:transposase
VKDLVSRLDAAALRGLYSGVGSEGYDPVLMLRMVMYQYVNGLASPAQWHKGRSQEKSIPLKWLGCGIEPSRTAWYDFRDRVGPLIQELNEDFVRQVLEQGYISGEIAVQDGTFIRANATRHHFFNRERLESHIQQLQTFIEQDQQGYPASVNERPMWMAATPRGRRRQLRRDLVALEQLKLELTEIATRPPSKRMEEKQVKISRVDPEATLGRDKEKVYCPLYNVQYMVDFHSRIILTYGVFSQANDYGTLIPLLDQTNAILSKYPKWALTDSGYVSNLDLKDCKHRGVTLTAPYQENSFTQENKKQNPPKQIPKELFQWSEPLQIYTCPQGHQLKFERCGKVLRRGNVPVKESRYRCPAHLCQACPLVQQCCQNSERGRTIKRVEGEEYLTEHLAYMKTEAAQELYRKRGSIIELPFADLKQHRNGRRLHSRGLKRVKAEIGLYVLAQNFMTLHRLETQRATSSNAAA